jgi:hypothetical protein
MGAWPEREAPAERIASVILPVEKGMDSSIPFSVARCFFFRVVTHDEVAVPEHCIPRADSLTPSSAMITSVRRCSVNDHCRNNALNHNPTHQRGIHGTIEEPQMLNPSLTFRVGMAANAQLQKASARDLAGQRHVHENH